MTGSLRLLKPFLLRRIRKSCWYNELVSKPYLNVIPGSTRCRMAVVTRRRMTVVTRGSFCHSGLDPESAQILNPQYHSVRGRQVQDDDNR